MSNKEQTSDFQKTYNIIDFISCEVNADIKTVSDLVTEDVMRIVYKLVNNQKIKDLQNKP